MESKYSPSPEQLVRMMHLVESLAELLPSRPVHDGEGIDPVGGWRLLISQRVVFLHAAAGEIISPIASMLWTAPDDVFNVCIEHGHVRPPRGWNPEIFSDLVQVVRLVLRWAQKAASIDVPINQAQQVIDRARSCRQMAEKVQADTAAALERDAKLQQFHPTPIQQMILDALDGRATTGEALLITLNCGSKQTLYGKGRDKQGGLTELKELGLVVNDRRKGGYYRPDAPPI